MTKSESLLNRWPVKVARRVALNPNTNPHRPTKKNSRFAPARRSDHSGKEHWKRPPKRPHGAARGTGERIARHQSLGHQMGHTAIARCQCGGPVGKYRPRPHRAMVGANDPPPGTWRLVFLLLRHQKIRRGCQGKNPGTCARFRLVWRIEKRLIAARSGWVLASRQMGLPSAVASSLSLLSSRDLRPCLLF